MKKTEHWHLKCSKFGLMINFYCQCPLRQSLKLLSLIGFAELDSTLASSSGFTTMGIHSE